MIEAKKKDGSVVDMKDVKPGETVTLTLKKPVLRMGLRAPGGVPAPTNDTDLGAFTLNAAAFKTPEEVRAALALPDDGDPLACERVEAQLGAWTRWIGRFGHPGPVMMARDGGARRRRSGRAHRRRTARAGRG